MDTVKHSQMSDLAYEILRDEILTRRIPPGARLTVRPLCEATGLSPTPIKAALTVLAQEGLVRQEPYRGYFVSVIDQEDLIEIYELRQVLDGIAARRAASLESRDELVAKLRDLLQRQRECAADPDHHTYSELDLQFHAAIVESSKKPRLIQLSADLMAQLRLGRVMSTSVPGQIERSLDEHRQIIDVIEAGNGVAAERFVRQHVAAASKALQHYLVTSDGG